MKWLIWMLKSAFNVSITLSGPTLNAALILFIPIPGMLTQRSRGNETAKVFFEPGSTWITIIVSDR